MRGRSFSAARLAGALVVLVFASAGLTRGIDHLLFPPVVTEVASGRSMALPNDQKLTEERADAVVGHLGPDRPVDASTAGTRRLWFAKGRWWGIFATAPSGAHHIWALTGPEGPWVDTGVAVDDRPFASVSVALTDDRLVVMSTGSKSYRSHALRVSEYSWGDSSQGWVLAPDSSVDVTEAGVENTQFMVADDGRIWFARLVEDQILVAHSDPARVRFTDFEALPDGVGAAEVGNFAMMAGGALPRFVWRGTTADTLTVATSDGTTWTTKKFDVYGAAGTGALDATDAGPSRPGSVLVLLETSLYRRGSNDQDPSSILVSVGDRGAEVSVVARASDHFRHPGLVVDRQAGTIHVIAAVEPSATELGPQTWLVTDKAASLRSLNFGVGAGATLVREPVGSLDRPMLPVAVDGDSGLVVAASGPNLDQWYAAQQGGPAPVGPVAPAPSVVTLVHDTFDRLVSGSGAPTSWFGGNTVPLAATVVTEAGGTGQALRVVNELGGAAPTACRFLPGDPGRIVSLRAVVTASGRGSGDTRLMTVRGPNGTLASVRISRKSVLGFVGPAGRVDQTFVADNATLTVSVEVDTQRDLAAISVASADGARLFESTDVELLSDPGDGPEEVCFAPGPDRRGTSITVAELKVESR